MRTHFFLLLVLFANLLSAQDSTYENLIPAEPPYYRVRYAASTKAGELTYPVSYTIWIPPGLKTVRGIVVHQHGCGVGSCKSGQTAAYDLHWQSLAKKHDCALMGATYEQPDQANCQLWCDPRNGSDAAFQNALSDLATQTRYPELDSVPWAIWGHSGGGHWAGGMMLLHPDRVVAVWLRSGVPQLKAVEGKPEPYAISEAACKVPVMCNLGTKEGVTVKDGRFAKVWPGVKSFFGELRAKGGLVGVAVDPLTSHECGNQRYLAIPWLDACLSSRLPASKAGPLKAMKNTQAWLVTLDVESPKKVLPVPAAKFDGALRNSVWLPDEFIAKAWTQYVKDTAVADVTPPPSPTNLKIKGNRLTWEAEADLQSGLAGFVIERDGKFLAKLPAQSKNRFGRPLFQNLQYSDTPTQPLVAMSFTDAKALNGVVHRYRVIAVNTVGLKSR